MIAKDPTEELLKAFYGVLNGHLSYGSAVPVGTGVTPGGSRYVYIYVEGKENRSTGDAVIFYTTTVFEIVTKQNVTEMDEAAVNSIYNQVIQLVTNPATLTMTNFYCLTSIFGNMEHIAEETDTNYIITKRLRINNFVEQK